MIKVKCISILKTYFKKFLIRKNIDDTIRYFCWAFLQNIVEQDRQVSVIQFIYVWYFFDNWLPKWHKRSLLKYIYSILWTFLNDVTNLIVIDVNIYQANHLQKKKKNQCRFCFHVLVRSQSGKRHFEKTTVDSTLTVWRFYDVRYAHFFVTTKKQQIWSY